jgi:dihydrofolate reductase
MEKRPVVLIAAVADNNVIGDDNRLIWRLKTDLKRFRSLTLGRPVLMGRKTFLSIGKPLPGRETVVLTRDSGFSAEGVSVAHSLDELTVVHAKPSGDARFPDWERDAFIAGVNEHHPADAENEHPYTFVTWRRRG